MVGWMEGRREGIANKLKLIHRKWTILDASFKDVSRMVIEARRRRLSVPFRSNRTMRLYIHRKPGYVVARSEPWYRRTHAIVRWFRIAVTQVLRYVECTVPRTETAFSYCVARYFTPRKIDRKKERKKGREPGRRRRGERTQVRSYNYSSARPRLSRFSAGAAARRRPTLTMLRYYHCTARGAVLRYVTYISSYVYLYTHDRCDIPSARSDSSILYRRSNEKNCIEAFRY